MFSDGKSALLILQKKAHSWTISNMPSLAPLAESNNASQARSSAGSTAPSHLGEGQFSSAAADENHDVPSITTRGKSMKTIRPVVGSAVPREQDVVFGKKYG